MNEQRKKAVETAEFLKRGIDRTPSVGIFTGTGLGDSVETMRVERRLPYHEIPNFPVSTVESHHGNLLLGTLAERSVMVLQGRFHLYEGYSAKAVTFPVRVMQEMGVKTLIITNAAGGLNPAFTEGDIMIIRDHINLTGENPLVGPNEERWGIRFPEMNHIYDTELAERAREGGREIGVELPSGVYAGLKGPSLETPAEVRFIKTIGGDAVGFSTVQEVIAGVHAGMRILGLSTLTNINDPDDPQPAKIEDIIKVAGDAAPKLNGIIRYVVAHCE